MTHFAPETSDFWVSIGFIPVGVFLGLCILLIVAHCGCCCLPGRWASPQLLRRLLVLPAILGCGSGCLILGWSNTQLGDGLSNIHHSADQLTLKLSSISVEAGDIVEAGTRVITTINQIRSNSLCPVLDPQLQSLTSVGQEVVDQTGTLITQLADVVHEIAEAQTQSHRYAYTYREWVVWAIAGSIIGLFLFAVCSVLLERCVCISIVISTLGFTILATSLVLSLFATGFIGCFCQEPTVNVIDQIPFDDVVPYLQYFSSCNGTNPVDQLLDPVQGPIEQAVIGVDALRTACPAATYQLDDTQGTLNATLVTIARIGQAAACPSIQRLWQRAVDTGVCSDISRGVQVLWICQVVAVTMLIVFQLINKWRIQKEQSTVVLVGMDSVGLLPPTQESPLQSPHDITSKHLPRSAVV